MMSGSANQEAFGNPGMGQSPWGAAPGSRPHDRTKWEGSCWPGQAWAWWWPSRPLLIAATILGFMVFWPIGLVLLLFTLWSKHMGYWAFGRPNGDQSSPQAGVGPGWGPWSGPCGGRWAGWNSRRGDERPAQSSGNRAFDEYREQTLRRLEEEQREFTAFLDRLRFAKDKAEFDQFMAERRQPPAAPPPSPEPSPEA